MSNIGKLLRIARDTALFIFTILGAIGTMLSVPTAVQDWLIKRMPSLAWISSPSSLTWATTALLIFMATLIAFWAGRRSSAPRTKRAPLPEALPDNDLAVFRILALIGGGQSVERVSSLLEIPVVGVQASAQRLRDIGLVRDYLSVLSLTAHGVAYADKHGLHTLPAH